MGNGGKAGMSATPGCSGTIKYTPKVWENVGEALAVSLLDMSQTNSMTRLGGPYMSSRTKTGFVDRNQDIARERCAPTLLQLQR